jgi:hypothetical protein
MTSLSTGFHPSTHQLNSSRLSPVSPHNFHTYNQALCRHLTRSKGKKDIRAAAVLAFVVTTSFAIVYAKTLSYLLNVLMAAIYSSSRLVVQAGDERSIEPFRGRAMSSLSG